MLRSLVALAALLTAFGPLAAEPAQATDDALWPAPPVFNAPYVPGRTNRAPNVSTGDFSVPAEQRYIPFSGDLPGCEDTDSLWWIKDRFDHTQATFWNSSLQIVKIDRIKEIGFRSNGATYIPRRYCVGRAELTNKKFHTIVYQIQERTGVAGYNDGVEWCVIGYDRSLAYAPSCSVLRPLAEKYANDKLVIPNIPVVPNN